MNNDIPENFDDIVDESNHLSYFYTHINAEELESRLPNCLAIHNAILERLQVTYRNRNFEMPAIAVVDRESWETHISSDPRIPQGGGDFGKAYYLASRNVIVYCEDVLIKDKYGKTFLSTAQEEMSHAYTTNIQNEIILNVGFCKHSEQRYSLPGMFYSLKITKAGMEELAASNSESKTKMDELVYTELITDLAKDLIFRSAEDKFLYYMSHNGPLFIKIEDLISDTRRICGNKSLEEYLIDSLLKGNLNKFKKDFILGLNRSNNQSIKLLSSRMQDLEIFTGFELLTEAKFRKILSGQ